MLAGQGGFDRTASADPAPPPLRAGPSLAPCKAPTKEAVANLPPLAAAVVVVVVVVVVFFVSVIIIIIKGAKPFKVFNRSPHPTPVTRS